jgi:hypothetical protein
MIDLPLPPVDLPAYSNAKLGFFGELGKSTEARVRFLQTGLTGEDLDSITLIEQIPGSEMWEVRDLFQRDVDKERVTKEILPYLKDTAKVKFFNPLTLALLPLSDNGQVILKDLPYVEACPDPKGGPYTVLEWPGYYKFSCHRDVPAYSKLEWNKSKVRVVAIDGQHRLSALKRWRNEPPSSSSELSDWTVPAVVLGVFKSAAEGKAPTFLDVVRKTFVYINSTAKEINPARKVLLNDESVVSICTQELIQDCHHNDCLPSGQRDEQKPPLLLFDWRGEVQGDFRVKAPAAHFTVEEVRDWLSAYILGEDEDGSDEQASALELEDHIPPLKTFGHGRALSHVDSEAIREQFRKTALPGLQHLMQTFAPLKAYIEQCRLLEREKVKESDLAHHAFAKLRFGTHRASEDILPYVNQEFERVVTQFEALKGRLFDELLTRDIGMRGIMSAYGYGKLEYNSDAERTTQWLEYSHWFVEALDAVYADGWFRSFFQLDPAKKKILTHVAYDPSGAIINYKLDAVPKGFGAVVLALVFSAGRDRLQNNETVESVIDGCAEELRGPLLSGYRKQYRAQLAQDFKGSPAEFNEQVRKRALGAVERHVESFRSIFADD